MVEVADMLGYAGMVTGTSFMIPQLYKTYETKSVEDLSWGMIILLILNCFLWGSYGYLTNGSPVLITNITCFVIIAILGILKFAYRNNP